MYNLSRQFAYLDRVRDGGRIDMAFAAAPLAKMYQLSKKEASAILAKWMDKE